MIKWTTVLALASGILLMSGIVQDVPAEYQGEVTIGTFVDLDEIRSPIVLYKEEDKMYGMAGHIGWRFSGCADETLTFCLISEDLHLFLVVPKNVDLGIDVKWSYVEQDFRVVWSRDGLFIVDCCVRQISSKMYTQRFLYSERTGVIAFMYGTGAEECSSCFKASSYFVWSGEQYPENIFGKRE